MIRYTCVAITALCLTCGTALAQLQSVGWDGSSLHMHWGDDDDWVRLSTDDQGFLALQDDPQNIYARGDRLFSDHGAAIPVLDIDLAVFDLGGGNDRFVSPAFSVNEYVFIFGGPGDDDIQLPYGRNAEMFAWGGEGNDRINAYDAYDSYLYGGPGDDYLYGGLGGYHFRDLGPGNGSYNAPFGGGSSTLVLHPGSNVNVLDGFGTDTHYILAPGEADRIGRLSIFDLGGTNTIELNGHSFAVDGTTIVSDAFSGQWFGSPPVTVSPSTAGVPEPAAWVLVGLCCLACPFIRKALR